MTVTKQSGCDIINNLVAVAINAGCHWGSDYYPPGSNPAWFAGPAAGLPNRVGTDSSMFAGDIDNDLASDTVRHFIGFFGCIRKVRIVTWMQGNGLYSRTYNGGWYTYTPVATSNRTNTSAWTQLIHDGYAVANGNLAYVPLVSETTSELPASRVPQGVLLTKAALETYCNDMVAKYKQYAWSNIPPGSCHASNGVYTNLPTLQNTVCHSSCHSNCHGSRNRR